MDRKLRHLSIGFPSLAAGLALSLLVVLAARPASGSRHDINLAGAAAAGAEAVAVSALNAALHQAAPEADLPDLSDSPSSRPTRKATRRRQSLLMPYFSFASRD